MKIQWPVSFICLLLAGCTQSSSSDGGEEDRTAPSISISSPSDNQSFSAGETIRVTATATDDNKVSQLHIHITNKITGALLRDVHAYPNAKTGTVEDAFSAAAGVTYTVRVLAYDPSQNIGTAGVEISVN